MQQALNVLSGRADVSAHQLLGHFRLAVFDGVENVFVFAQGARSAPAALIPRPIFENQGVA